MVGVSSPVKEIKEKSLPSKDEHFHSSSFFLFFETDLCHEKPHKRERAPTNYDRSLNFYKLLSFFSFRKKVVGSIMMTSPKKKKKKTHKISSRACEKHVVLFCDLNLNTTNMMDVTPTQTYIPLGFFDGRVGEDPRNQNRARIIVHRFRLRNK